MTHASAVAVCPGCHFHCRLDHYQCGLGAYRWEQAQKAEGETGAPATRPAAAKPAAAKHHANASADVRIEHLLTVLPHKLRVAAGERVEDKLLCAVMRRRGLAAPSIMAKLLYTSPAGLQPSIDALENAGYLKIVDVDGRPGFMQLTAEGMAEGKRRAARHVAAYRDLLSCLSAEEQAELVVLLGKLMAATKTA